MKVFRGRGPLPGAQSFVDLFFQRPVVRGLWMKFHSHSGAGCLAGGGYLADNGGSTGLGAQLSRRFCADCGHVFLVLGGRALLISALGRCCYLLASCRLQSVPAHYTSVCVVGDVLAGRKSSVLRVRAAPGGPQTFQPGGGFASPLLGRFPKGPGSPDTQNKRSPAGQNITYYNPGAHSPGRGLPQHAKNIRMFDVI